MSSTKHFAFALLFTKAAHYMETQQAQGIKIQHLETLLETH